MVNFTAMVKFMQRLTPQLQHISFLKQFLTDYTITQAETKIKTKININEQLESTVCAIWGWVVRVGLRYRVFPAMEKITRRGHKKSNSILYIARII
jgi:hypothetical protein